MSLRYIIQSSKTKGREMRWSPEGGHVMATREGYVFPLPHLSSSVLISPSFFIGWWHSSGTKNFFFVPFFLLEHLPIDYYTTKSILIVPSQKNFLVSLA